MGCGGVTMEPVVVVAAGVVYHMKPWYRPGLPELTVAGELMVADEGMEGRKKN